MAHYKSAFTGLEEGQLASLVEVYMVLSFQLFLWNLVSAMSLEFCLFYSRLGVKKLRSLSSFLSYASIIVGGIKSNNLILFH